MKDILKTYVMVGGIFAILVLGIGLVVVWLGGEDRSSTHTSMGVGCYIRTVEHDGHKFVVGTSSGISILHHPDCPCLKPK
jgi:hypothetical protein